jgi:hypothetical protein
VAELASCIFLVSRFSVEPLFVVRLFSGFLAAFWLPFAASLCFARPAYAGRSPAVTTRSVSAFRFTEPFLKQAFEARPPLFATFDNTVAQMRRRLDPVGHVPS